MIDFSIRRLQAGDSLDDLTSMLHRAFSPLGRRGWNCTSVDQTAAITRRRSERGDCFVAVADRAIVATITLQLPDPSSPVRRYRCSGVASLHQFAVDPCYQGAGIGHALLLMASTWAAARQCGELALDTPAPAGELRNYYARQGFRLIGLVQLARRTYESAVMAKRLNPVPRRVETLAWPARHPAEMAAIAQESRLRARR